MTPGPADRRRFPRVKAPVLVRPASVLTLLIPREVADISAGGLRTYADEARRPGERLELELLLPGGESVTVLAEVVWSEPLPGGAPAAHEVGLRFVAPDAGALARIAAVLEG